MALLVAGYDFVAIPVSPRKEKYQNGYLLTLLTAQHIGVVRKTSSRYGIFALTPVRSI
jgi:hypothetical protein